MSGRPGTLRVVATPIGNLEDLSPRAVEALRSAALVACEDTRQTAKLLARCGLDTRLASLHRFNEGARAEEVLALLREGRDVALVSDGGTPAVSDPGRLLVALAHEEGIPVSPVPGPSAALALLSASGLPADAFVFEGFLPSRGGERRARLRALRGETRTVVAFEAPHRIREALADLGSILGDRPVVLGRELTKLHEEVRRGTAASLLAGLPAEPRGEMALAIGGAREGEAGDDAEAGRVRAAWAEAVAGGGGSREALRRAARALGMKRPELYRRLAELGIDPEA